MRSWKTRLLALVAVMALLVSIAGPAMAQDFERCRDFGDVVRCDGDFFVEVDDDFFFDDDDFFFSPFFFSPFFFDDDFNDVADELCSPLNPDAVNELVPGCIFA